MASKYIEDDLGPVENAPIETLLQIALLGRGEVAIEDDDVRVNFGRPVSDFLDLATADGGRGLERLATLKHGPDDFRSRPGSQFG